MNVILSLDENFIDFTKTTMVSLLNNTSEYIHFFLLTNSNSVTVKTFDVIKRVKDCDIDVVKVPKKLYSYLLGRKIFNHLSEATYFRHFASELIPDVNKAVYLDSDTLVVGDLSQIMGVEINNSEYVRGVEDAASEKKKQLLDLKRYVNAGVLLMNLDNPRSDIDDFYEKIHYFYDHFGEKTISGDQDMLNFVFRPRYLPFRYNLYHPFFNKQFIPSSCSKEEYFEECKLPVVIHFVGSRKPWLKDVVHPYKSLWNSVYNLMKHLDV